MSWQYTVDAAYVRDPDGDTLAFMVKRAVFSLG